MGVRVDPTFGLVVFPDTLAPDALKATGVGSTDSAYTEADLGPGPSTSTGPWRPAITDAHTVDLQLQSIRSGFPGRTGGARVVYRLGSEAGANLETDWRSWSEPNLITGWTSHADLWGSGAEWTSVSIVGLRSTGEILVAAGDDTTGIVGIYRYNPRSDVWTVEDEIPITGDGFSPGEDLFPVLVPIPGTDPERVLLYVCTGTTAPSGGGSHADGVFYSDDLGASWGQYARSPWPVTEFTEPPGIVAVEGGDWLAVTDRGQFASSTAGDSWDLVDAAWDDARSAVARPGGGFVVASRDPTTAGPIALILPTARTPLSDVTQIDIDASNSLDSAPIITSDDDGVLYVFGRTAGRYAVWRSTDGGLTWGQYTDDLVNLTEDEPPLLLTAVPSGGSVWLAMTGGINDTSGLAGVGAGWVGLLRCGGWASWEAATASDRSALATDPLGRFGFGGVYDVGTGTYDGGWAYVPLLDPANAGWTDTPGTPAATMTLDGTDPGALQLTGTSAPTRVYSKSQAYGGGDPVVLNFLTRVRYISGGVKSGTTTDNTGMGVDLRIDDGVDSATVALQFGTDGFDVIEGGIVLASVAIDLTVATDILVSLFKGTSDYRILVLYRQSPFPTKWTAAIDATVGTSTLAAPGLAVGTWAVTWGKSAGSVAGTQVCSWRLVAANVTGTVRRGIDSGLAFSLEAPETGFHGLLWGKSLSGRGFGYPIPDATASTEQLGRVFALGGPTNQGERVSLLAASEHPIEAIHPSVEPSRRRGWRATGTSEVRLVWEWTASTAPWLGGALALYVDGEPRPRLFVVERDNGSGSFETLGTLDLAVLDTVAYTRSGVSYGPSGSAVGTSRYFGENELAGGYLTFGRSGSTFARRITANSAGYWTADTSLQRIRISVEGTISADPGSGSDLVVMAPRGLLVMYPTDPARVRVKVSIASGAVTPEGRYQAGILALGRVIGIGSIPDWGWNVNHTIPAQFTRAIDGVSSARALGPPRRAVTYSWPAGSPAHLVRSAGSYGDLAGWVGASGGAPIAMRHDGPWSLPGVFALTGAGASPVVCVPRLPVSTSTLTDPTRFIFGRITSDRIRLTNKQGTEGVDELVGAGELSIEEIP